MSGFLVQEIACHNINRARHGSPAVFELVDMTNTVSQPYADRLAAMNTFPHSGNKYQGMAVGENLFMTTGGKLKGGEACAAWYNENVFYDYNTGNMKPNSLAGAMISEYAGAD
jgi:hypothetical protein